mgnify:CR=1 FL=1
METTDRTDSVKDSAQKTEKKKRRKRTIDKTKVAENKKKAKEKRARKKGKRMQEKEPGRWKKRLALMVLLVIVLAAAGGAAGFFVQQHLDTLAAEREAVEAMVHTKAVALTEYSKTQHRKDSVRQNAGKDTTRALVDAARYMIEGIKNRPREVEVTADNATDFATIESCLINTETGKIDITMKAKDLALSDDGFYYLFEEKAYQTSLQGSEYLIEDQKDVDLTFSVNLNYNTTSSRLFSKFVVAVKKNGSFLAITKPRYITNPEAIAKYSPSFGATSSKKGLLVDPEKLKTSELDDLGVKHAAYNIPLSRILGQTSNANYPTVYYTYNGRNYAFNGQIIAEYDYIFTSLTNRGITTTAIILNDISSHPELIHPKARSGGHAPYYAFNAADESGTETIAAIASFLASRYSGTGHGKVMNWVIGNEINARSEWNHIEHMSTPDYVDEYARAFRIFYNALLSVNGNARVYISLDQQWGKSLYSKNGYGSKEILDEFNRNLKAEGNIDWGLAQHPYNYPLTSAKAWQSNGKYVQDTENTPVITIKNLHVLTDYLQKPEMLTEDGEVRHLILSEMGYTSSQGQELQAASFVYAYKMIEANQYVDSMLFSRETDAPSEVAQGLDLGLCTLGGGRKSIYEAYKYVDSAESAKYTDFALRVIGISSWSEVIKKR